MKPSRKIVIAAGYTVLTGLLLAENFTPTRAAIWLPIWAAATGAIVYSEIHDRRNRAAE